MSDEWCASLDPTPGNPANTANSEEKKFSVAVPLPLNVSIATQYLKRGFFSESLTALINFNSPGDDPFGIVLRYGWAAISAPPDAYTASANFLGWWNPNLYSLRPKTRAWPESVLISHPGITSMPDESLISLTVSSGQKVSWSVMQIPSRPADFADAASLVMLAEASSDLSELWQ